MFEDVRFFRSMLMSLMSKTVLIVVAAVILSFTLAYFGNCVIYCFAIGRGGNNRDQFVITGLIQVFVLLPAISTLIGFLIGCFDERNRWWLAAVSLAPLLAYGLSDSFAGPLLFLCLIYLILACASALLIASMKDRWRRGVLKSG